MVSDVTDPVGDVMTFIRNFNDKYGTEHPIFYQGSYSQVRNKLVNEWEKWMKKIKNSQIHT